MEELTMPGSLLKLSLAVALPVVLGAIVGMHSMNGGQRRARLCLLGFLLDRALLFPRSNQQQTLSFAQQSLFITLPFLAHQSPLRRQEEAIRSYRLFLRKGDCCLYRLFLRKKRYCCLRAPPA